MITMGGFSLPAKTIREMMNGSIDVIVQAARLRDGSRRITHITEVVGMEGDVIITQDLFLYDMLGEDGNGNILGRHRSTGIGRPAFWDRARYFGEEKRLAAALDAAADRDVGHRRLPAYARDDAVPGGELLRHRHPDPAAGRRQFVGSARKPFARTA
jgi:pilus assembly protein CpaF